MQELLYLRIFIGLFIIFIVSSYFYKNTWMNYYKINKVTHIAYIQQIVTYVTIYFYWTLYLIKVDLILL